MPFKDMYQNNYQGQVREYLGVNAETRAKVPIWIGTLSSRITRKDSRRRLPEGLLGVVPIGGVVK